MSPFQKAKIAAAAKCHELAACERVELDRLRGRGYVERYETAQTVIRRLEEAADAIMALPEEKDPPS